MHRWPLEIEQTIVDRRLLADDQPVLVGVSGGVDSVSLLHVFHLLSPLHRWNLTVAHLNHGLRGRESDLDARFIERMARCLDLPCVVESVKVNIAQERGASIEMVGRRLRHEFLGRTAERLQINTIALAHHADDQIELFFLRLLRGGGGEALGGMRWIRPAIYHPRIHLIRPLLGQSKEAIHAYAAETGLKFREDSSNASPDFLRNRVRRVLIPAFQRHFGPSALRTVLRSMDIIAAESEVVTEAAAGWVRQRRRKPFDRLGLALQRQCLRLQLENLGLSYDFELIEQLRQFPGRRISAGAMEIISRNTSGIVRRHESSPTFKLGESVIGIAETGVCEFDDVRLRWRTIAGAGGLLPPRRDRTEYFDRDKVGDMIRLRHWRPGDRFQPIGLNGEAKLQDLFANAHIGREERHRLVVATTGEGTVFWVEGLRLGECFKLDKGTRRRLKWQWLRSRGNALR